MNNNGMASSNFYEAFSLFLDYDQNHRLCRVNKAANKNKDEQAPYTATLIMCASINGLLRNKGEEVKIKPEQFLILMLGFAPTLELANSKSIFMDDGETMKYFKARILTTPEYSYDNVYIMKIAEGQSCIIGKCAYAEGEYITRQPQHTQMALWK